MKYKIDTRENFDIITPLYADFDTILAEQFNELVDDSRVNGRSLLIDLMNVNDMDASAWQKMETLHHEMYNDNLSLIICHVHSPSKKIIAELELEHVLNITPTMEEAIDLISMEGLERELLGEE